MNKKLVAPIALLMFVVTGCAALKVAEYDPYIHTTMTEVKADVAQLYQSFKEETVNQEKIDTVRKKLVMVQDYAKSEEGNSETNRQLEIVKGAFERHVANRLEHGAWSETHCTNTTELITDMIDHVIKLELTKPKGR